jgi:hypothetical protein
MKLVKKNSTGSYNEYNDNGDRVLRSYAVIVARKSPGIGIFLDEKYWDYSVTTSTHIGMFLGESMREVRKKIKQGIINLTNLN